MIKIVRDINKAFLVDNTETGERTTLYKSPDRLNANDFTKSILVCPLKHIFRARNISNDFGIPVMFLKIGDDLIETYTFDGMNQDTINDFRARFWLFTDGDNQENTKKAIAQEIINLFEE